MMTETIARRAGDYLGDGGRYLIWEILDGRGVAAELYVFVDTHEIANIETRSDRRGEGLARALYRAADTQVGVFHAPAGHRTEEGDAFARAVGGPVADYPCDCFACDTIDDEEDDD
ncbi:hypothetical protein [Saccharothrix violaceirubra]|uniref:GNAT superfamily N-acetyltransferase n=1 Tax=Saccharothrix violaceirubra TaxID=413306 RepID=A0A7W7T1T2_9PSEU|nr:hypothetical protein [Saccharothrix violaceirubra]MBB4963780.1 GNAT superfamily N-acetyltransferase [Saccharothrix violaceirubra]